MTTTPLLDTNSSQQKDILAKLNKLEQEAIRKELLAQRHLSRSKRKGGEKAYEKAVKISEEANDLWKEIAILARQVI